jgi:hypothetical protein
VIKASPEDTVGDSIRGVLGHPAVAGRFKNVNCESNVVDALALPVKG